MTRDTFESQETVMEIAENLSLPSSSMCPPEGRFPTTIELKLGLGAQGSTALLTSAIVVLIVNAVLFSILLAKFFKKIPQSQVYRISFLYCSFLLFFAL